MKRTMLTKKSGKSVFSVFMITFVVITGLVLTFGPSVLYAQEKMRPTAPTGLTATAESESQVNLSWTASTDNVGVTGYQIERCEGAGCSSYALVTTVTGTTYNDTGLLASTSYRYRARATDAANNLSVYSNIASVATLDTTVPTAPTSLTAAAESESQINLSWSASTDNVGVTRYQIERCKGAGCSSFTQIATTTGTTYNNTGLLASRSYSYRVRAKDAANNLSVYSNITSAETLDTTAPTAPTSLTAAAESESQVNLSWSASTDNVGVTRYRIERCKGAGCSSFTQIATTTTTTYNNTGLVASRSYSYRVSATDAANNLSDYSDIASAATPDTTAPTAPTGLTAAAESESQINLSWSASTDNVGVTRYQIERCKGAGCSSFVQIATTTATTYNNTGLLAARSYSYRVRATDAVNNPSDYSDIVSAKTPDTTAPTVPVSLTAAVENESQVNLSWTASTDNVGVTGYQIERCEGAGCSSFSQIATTTGTTYNNTGLLASMSYSYRVRATDAANNPSDYSNITSAATLDTTAPTAPTGLTAAAESESQINLSWSASTDNVGVTGYQIERCTGASCSSFSQIATTTGTTYNNTGLLASTSYSYRVRATDAANNLSVYSNIAGDATPDTTAPTAPASLTATVASESQINLSWTASTDNVGVTGYQIERCEGASCSSYALVTTVSGTTYNNTGLLAWNELQLPCSRKRCCEQSQRLLQYSQRCNAGYYSSHCSSQLNGNSGRARVRSICPGPPRLTMSG